MSILPLFANDNWHPVYPIPMQKGRTQGLGLNLDNLLSLITQLPNIRASAMRPVDYYTTMPSTVAKSDKGSTIKATKDKFQVNLDVQQFAPEEITVKVIGNNTITVEGKHEEKQDEHGVVSRHFVRRYVLPDGHGINNIVSNLSLDGVLSITAPHLDRGKEEQQHTIPIQQTGVAIKSVKEKRQGDQKAK